MRQKFPGDRSNPAIKNRLLSSLIRHLPGAWVDPKHNELISLYRLRYRMALEEKQAQADAANLRVQDAHMICGTPQWHIVAEEPPAQLVE